MMLVLVCLNWFFAIHQYGAPGSLLEMIIIEDFNNQKMGIMKLSWYLLSNLLGSILTNLTQMVNLSTSDSIMGSRVYLKYLQ